MDSFIINAFLNPSGSQTLLITLIFTWSLIWKGLALWRSAASNDKLWFVALLVVNTMGLLEIAYLFYLSKNKLKPEEIKMFFNNLNVKKLKALQSSKKESKPKKLISPK